MAAETPVAASAGSVDMKLQNTTQKAGRWTLEPRTSQSGGRPARAYTSSHGGPHQIEGVAAGDHAGPHPVIENQASVFQAILKMDVGRARCKLIGDGGE